MEIKLMLREEVINNWPDLKGYFINALSHGQGESALIDYLQKIMNYQAQCWLITDGEIIMGAGLTEILNYNQHKTLHIILLGGSDFPELAKLLPTVEQFAKDNGCRALENWGRQGWSRVLQKHIPDFKEVYRVFRKDL